MANGEDDTGFRVTTGVLYVQLQSVKDTVAEIKTSQEVANSTMLAAIQAMAETRARVEKIEGRMNGVFVGIGAGVLTALVAVFKGVIG
jgi:hypothetical protein